ncbi:MAG: hypothetical protein JTT14_00250 [Candidatus Brockarchaeota archaeon]|nr:hypothetical protein [Candidatus Brockarchaeota archaeon]
MTISYFYGTVDSQKSLLLYNQVFFSKKYLVPINVIYPHVYYQNNKETFDKFKVCYEGSCVNHKIKFFPNDSLDSVKIYTVYHVHLFSIDEIKLLLRKIYSQNSFALISFIGLEKDYTGKTYATHEYLMQYSNYTEKLPSVCKACTEEEAEYNQAIINGEEATYIPEDIQMRDLYEARCEKCYISTDDVLR